LQRELATTYGPGDALWDQQLAELAKLYWRRNRIERMETGLMRRALQAVEERQRTRRRRLDAVTFDVSKLPIDLNLGEPTERCVQLCLLLSRLEVRRPRDSGRDAHLRATPLRLSAPPAEEDLSIPGCESATLASGCPWDTFNKAIERAIDRRFVSMEPEAN